MFIQSGLTKTRTILGPQLFLREARRNSPSLPWVVTTTKAQMDGIQITESDGNPWPPKSKMAKQDVGSEFYSRKIELVSPNPMPFSIVNVKGTGVNFNKSGILSGSVIANCCQTLANDPNYLGQPRLPFKLNFPPDLSSSREVLVEKGARAIAACAPSNQIAEVAASLGELFQQVPAIPGVTLWKSRLRAAETLSKSLANEFLNLSFGVLPTIADMKEFLEASHKYDKALDQFIRDAGRNVRREFHFPTEESTTEEVLEDVYSPAGMAKHTAGHSHNFCYPVYGGALPGYETIRSRTIKREIWFKGAFIYHLPVGYDYQSDMDRRRLMAKLFGAEPDLNTLWQLAPWSWAVDWVSNASSVIKNLQNYFTYGSIMRYGYVMETTTITDTYTAGKIVAPVHALNVGQYTSFYLPRVTPVILRTTVKKRIQANPFGFGFSWEGLSLFQQAIAAAIGITRRR